MLEKRRPQRCNHPDLLSSPLTRLKLEQLSWVEAVLNPPEVGKLGPHAHCTAQEPHCTAAGAGMDVICSQEQTSAQVLPLFQKHDDTSNHPHTPREGNINGSPTTSLSSQV